MAEAELDIQPINAAFENTREAVARVLTWFVLRKNKRKLPKVLHIAGIDILKIPEVQKEVEELKAFKRTFEKFPATRTANRFARSVE